MAAILGDSADCGKDVDHPEELPSEYEAPDGKRPARGCDVKVELVRNVTSGILVEA